MHETSQWTTSVCTGSLLLAAAGLLDGLDAATHLGAWAGPRQARRAADRPKGRRGGKIITAAGVSAGIDMALTLAARIAGDDIAKAIQLEIEYDPRPPFDAGSPEAAGEAIVALVHTITAVERENA